jgi:hypothetical protein
LKVSHDISLAPSDARPCMYRRTSPIPDEPAAGAPLREVIKNRVTGLMGLSSVQYNPPNKTDCVPTEVCRYRKRRLQGEVRSPHVTFPPPSFHPFALPDTHTQRHVCMSFERSSRYGQELISLPMISVLISLFFRSTTRTHGSWVERRATRASSATRRTWRASALTSPSSRYPGVRAWPACRSCRRSSCRR